MRNNRIATTLQIVGTSIISIGIIFGSMMAIDNQDFGNYAFFLFVSYALGGAIIGIFFLGMSEIVEKLHNIELSVNTTPEEENVKIGMKEMKNEMTSENLPLSEEKLSFIKRYLDKAPIEYEAIRGTPFEGVCLVILKSGDQAFYDLDGFSPELVKKEDWTAEMIDWLDRR